MALVNDKNQRETSSAICFQRNSPKKDTHGLEKKKRPAQQTLTRSLPLRLARDFPNGRRAVGTLQKVRNICADRHEALPGLSKESKQKQTQDWAVPLPSPRQVGGLGETVKPAMQLKT